MHNDEPIIATKGLVGWNVKGKCQYGTFSAGPYNEMPQCRYAVDMSEVYKSKGIHQSVNLLWGMPTLDLALPSGNVRALFEGCIGCEGHIEGHKWDGKEELKSTNSVGIDVYLIILEKVGGIRLK
jgi:hypothetical protein